ncbi:Mu-like prophage FluMu protein [Gluconobacter frateurii M-2]|nr:Mu-like prophage FluMu protein [Gluconobacter frateurii M-2]
MSAKIPTPAELARRFASALAQQTVVASDGSVVTLDATAPATLESALAILSAMSDYEIYLFLRDQLLELMPQTATVTPGTGLLPQHAQIWRTPRVSATSAVGNFVLTASQDVSLPEGVLITVDGSAQWRVLTAVEIVAGAALSVAVQATVAGSSGNLPANTAATLVSPIAGISSVVSDQNGLAGGSEIEPVESWRARIIDAIRNPDGGGNAADYLKWAKQAGAGSAKVIPGWLGRGTVGLIVVMPGGIAATPAQVAEIQAYIDTVRPVRGNLTVSSAVIVPQDVTVLLNPDTQVRRSAVTAALSSFFPAQGIGATIYREGVESTITTVAGSQNLLISPAENSTLAVNQFPVLGTINWTVT